MRVISFAWTTPALLAGKKTCTRRDWNDKYADAFNRGEIVLAYDRQPRYKGKPVATIQLTAKPYLQSTKDAPASDYQAEGFEYLQALGKKVDGLSPAALWRAWHLYPQMMYVVRFELMRVVMETPDFEDDPREVGYPSQQPNLFDCWR